MVKKIKKKIKTTLKIMSFCHFGLEVLVYMTLGWTLFGTLFILFKDKVYYQISVHARECVF